MIVHVCESKDDNSRLLDLNSREREKRKNEIKDFISCWMRERISKLPEVQLPVTTTTARDLLATHHTETVQSFFPTCKLFLE